LIGDLGPVATARHLGVPVIMRDARILTYARRSRMAAIRR